MFRTDTYISFPDLVTSSSTSGEEETANGKTPQNSEQEENENSREESSEINGTKEFVRRLSPEGAENSALNALMTSDEGNTDSYLLVPDKRFVSEAQRRDALGSCLGYSPSGRMDDKDYWTLNDDIDGRCYGNRSIRPKQSRPQRSFIAQIISIVNCNVPRRVILIDHGFWRVVQQGSNVWVVQSVFWSTLLDLVVFFSSGKEVVDGGCQDRVPLIDPGKARVMYTPEEGFEEMEEGVVVPCFSCDHCVLLWKLPIRFD